MAELKQLPVPDGIVGQRADAGLAKLLGVSRSAAADLLEADLVSLNGKVIGKADKLIADGFLEIQMPDPSNPLEIVPVQVDDFKIIYQDDDIIVIDKPAGVASHPSVGWDGPTVPGALLALGIQIATSGAQERQGIVQRLDVGTSGLMTLAKSELAYSRLKQAFRDRAVHKVYHAVIQGLADPLDGTFDAPIGRHPKHEFKFAVMNDGKHSVTHYETLEAFRAASLVEIILETGRTHQIRVHFSAFRHPLVGDTMYGADPVLAAKVHLNRQWLHAVKLSFEHPITGNQVEFESKYPAELTKALDILRSN
ncbi:RluA family pseudouridine synthase [Rhodoluna sp.]|uniref:RluA family pseudouridine synthase n=1 Tax=Rhodoluna sp. TaxID=1969481 RepID=UPI0025F6F7BD|nr:RluA family pseudouridine synthase [Rhodoluna sp.]